MSPSALTARCQPDVIPFSRHARRLRVRAGSARPGLIGEYERAG
jgi:hypothetical protein